MTLSHVKSSLDAISKSLAKLQDDREFLLANTRKIISLCGSSIISVHRGDAKSAREHLRRAKTLLKKYQSVASADLKKYLLVPEQEYVEAACLISIMEKKPLPSHKKLNVMPESYVLGLLDCVGELKRMIFDSMRAGDIGEASRVFEIMGEMYLCLYPFALYDKVLKDARRKTDVCRILVDDTRGAITEENRRSELIKLLGRLEK